MNKILKLTTIAIISSAAAMAVTSTGFAKQAGGKGSSSSGPSGGGNGDGKGPDGGRDALKRVTSSPLILNRYPDFPPQRPRYRQARYGESCVFLYNQITNANMLVTVPRYNECMRRGGNQ